MALPPYRRIVDDVRQRVARGDLRPGDRLPSTRALARRWRVANATATHALRELAHAGVARAIPRVGYVVAGAPASEPAPRESDLNRERIVRVAIEVADEEGFAALSIRTVAARLGAPAMSLYRHVGSREDLLHAMADAVMGEARMPERAPRDLRAYLRAGAHAQWAAFRRHPWLARVITMTRPLPLPNSLACAEYSLRGLREAGFDAPTALQLHVVLYGYMQGVATNLEAEAQARSDTGIDEQSWMAQHEGAFAALAASGKYPNFAGVMSELSSGFDLDLDAVFDAGLGALLAGIDALARKSRGRTRPRRKR